MRKQYFKGLKSIKQSCLCVQCGSINALGGPSPGSDPEGEFFSERGRERENCHEESGGKCFHEGEVDDSGQSIPYQRRFTPYSGKALSEVTIVHLRLRARLMRIRSKGSRWWGGRVSRVAISGFESTENWMR